ncbi:hypothetical protein ACFLX4_03355 [Chloroflexota bacterium]
MKLARMVTCGYHLLILLVQLQVSPGRKKGERRTQMKKAGIVVGAVLAVAVFGLGIRQWRNR